MRDAAVDLVQEGSTTVAEVRRVLGESETKPESVGLARRQRSRVLVADDDRMIRMLVRLLLDKAGYDVVEAEDGRRAVEVARAERPDLIIMDLTMPELDGYGAIQQIRADISLAAVPLIVLTSEVGPGVEQRVLELGADDYLNKPFDEPILQARVRAARIVPPRSGPFPFHSRRPLGASPDAAPPGGHVAGVRNELEHRRSSTTIVRS